MKRCNSMMKPLPCNYIRYSPTIVIAFQKEQYFAVDVHLDGHSVKAPTVNWFMKPIRRSIWIGHRHEAEVGLKMYCRVMNVQLETQRILAVGKADNDPETNQGAVAIRHSWHLQNVWFHNKIPLSCRPKHPVKVHVWAGISKQGATGIYASLMELWILTDM